MKIMRMLFSMVIVVVLCSAFTLADKPGKKIYIAGVSASFSDSVVYFTDIQSVEGGDVKNGLLMNRSQFSNQLKDYLEQNNGLKDRTCFVYFSEKKDKLHKEIKKIRAKYTKNKSVFIKELNESEFKFKKPEEE